MTQALGDLKEVGRDVHVWDGTEWVLCMEDTNLKLMNIAFRMEQADRSEFPDLAKEFMNARRAFEEKHGDKK